MDDNPDPCTEQERVLRDIVASVREGGQGISILIAGAGRDRRMNAAEGIAREAGLEVYRIDLAKVVSKFIGETEKNLQRVFEDARSTGSLLLFDEADALFSRRTEVKDSHDRFAQIDLNYLLQLIEAHRGGVIFAAKSRENLDRACLSRIRFVLEFA